MTREWFTAYCQNAAANVLDRGGKIRFTYQQLKEAVTDPAVMDLHEKIVQLCNNKCQHAEGARQPALVLTLLNIHAAYLMMSGLWEEEPIHNELGFEIF